MITRLYCFQTHFFFTGEELPLTQFEADYSGDKPRNGICQSHYYAGSLSNPLIHVNIAFQVTNFFSTNHHDQPSKILNHNIKT